MAQTLQTGTITTQLTAILTNALDLSTPDDTLSLSKKMTLTGGTGVGKGDQLWHDTRTLTTGATETLDLYGSLTNGLGQTVNFNTIRGMVIVNPSTTSTLEYGGAASNAWAPMFKSATDIGVIRMSASTTSLAYVIYTAPDATGYDVTAGTADQLKITHGGEDSISTSYQIILIGEQA
jgi:hypothetical protein